MTLEPGDIVLIPFPYTDLTSHKRRPVVLLDTPDERGDFPCLAITSRPQHTQAIALAPSLIEKGQLPKPSWVRIAKVYTLNTSLVAKHFGRLTAAALGQVRGDFCMRMGCRH
ncbi:type II toxin-antitoxin system PemK/MazF family toxin [Halomonas sp.]|uniref:type II toxin-antitoxin system PemK/MazF family toxin n=1 Tax=Halomonas sp. TaxID=1486246 RepID=UPI003D0C7E15